MSDPFDELIRMAEEDDSTPEDVINEAASSPFSVPTPSADVLDLAEQSGLPYDVVERNQEKIAEKVNKPDYNAMREASPSLVRQMEDPVKRAYLEQEAQQLSALESEGRGFLGNTFRGVAERTTQVTGNLIELVGELARQGERFATEGLDLPNPGIQFGPNGIEFVRDLDVDREMPVRDLGQEISDQKFGYTPRFSWDRLKGDITVENLAGYVVEQGAQSLPDMVVAITSLPAFIGSNTQRIAEERATHAGTGTPEQYAAAIVPAVLVSALERIGAKGVFKLGEQGSSIGLKALRAGGKEAGTEFLQEQIEYAGEVIGIKEFDVLESLERGLAGAVAGGGMGGVIRTTTAAIEEFTGKAGKARDSLAFMESMIKMGQSEMAQRSPETFRAYIEDYAADVGVEQIYVDAEVVANLAQSEQDGDLKALVEAANADVGIPLHTFVTMREGQIEALMPHVRLAPTDLSITEVEEGLDVSQMIEQAKTRKAEYERASEIFETYAGQIIDTGVYTNQQAKQMAVVIPAYVTTKAKREGLSVDEVYEQMGLRVESLSDGLAGLTEAPTQPDGVIPTGRIRGGSVTFRGQANNPEQSGAQSGDTLGAQSGDQNARPATRAATEKLPGSQQLPGSDGVLASEGGQDSGARWYGDLQGLKQEFEIDGEVRSFGAHKAARDAAYDYAESAGLDYNPPRTYAKVKRERAERIAQAFDDATHSPQDPEVVAAYEAMISETVEQYRTLMESGLEVEFIDYDKDGDPYESNPRKVMLDTYDNNHMWVFSTRDGFGSDDDFNPEESPMLRETEFQISGQPALVNDLFRVVHDYFGHIKDGVGFRAAGEENAWRAHSAMYSPLARKAMTTETRGQNSWVNYGPHGNKNRSASSDDTVFADQKMMLLPDWAVDEGAADPVVLNQSPRQAVLEKDLRQVAGSLNNARDKAQQDAVADFDPDTQTIEDFEKMRSNISPENQQIIEDLTAQFDSLKARIKQQENLARRNSIGLYSEVEKVALSLKIPGWMDDKSIDGKSAFNKIKSQPGIKKEELEWMGLEEFMSAGKVNRSETLAFIRNNGVTVEETLASDETSDNTDAEDDVEFDEEMLDFEEAEGRDYIEERIGEEFDSYWWENNADQWVADNISEVREHFEEKLDPEDYDELTDGDFINNEVEGFDVHEEMKSTAEEDEDVRDSIESGLADIYYESPVYKYTYETSNGTEVEIVGSDDHGYRTTVNGQPINERTEVWSYSEAQIQAIDELRDRGDLSENMDEKTPQWESYVTPGDYENYREMKLILPEIGGDFYNETHFPDRNLVAFLRVTDRDLNVSERQVESKYSVTPDGEEFRVREFVEGAVVDSTFAATEQAAQTALEVMRKSQGTRKVMDTESAFFIDEMQSDWHQDGRQQGYEGDVGPDKIEEARNLITLKRDQLSAEQKRVAESDPVVPDGFKLEPKHEDFIVKETSAPFRGYVGVTEEKAIRHAMQNVDEGISKAHDELFEAENSYNRMRGQVPNAPFKNDEWIKLALKRAIVSAVEQGKDYIAWADAEVLVDRWSDTYRELYTNQYDKRMPSAFKKITKIKPMHVRGDDAGLGFADNEVDSLGYWLAPITPELKQRVQDEGLSLFQENRAQIVLFPNERIIQLGENSDLSSFFHESGHLFLEMERRFAENGTARQKHDFQKVLDFLGATDADSITTEMHEKFARSFERYIGEGQAPSLELRPYFRRFAEWIKGVYRTLNSLNVELTDDIRGVMDRMLATDEEIARARQKFGFDLATNAAEPNDPTDRAEETLRAKAIKQLRRRAEKWWKDESAELAIVVGDEIAQEKVYRTMDVLRDTPIDRAQAKELLGGRKLDGNLRGITANNSVSAEYMAEFLGYASAEGMLNQIIEAQPINAAIAEEVERRMIETHGDMLNDGTIEAEAEAAVHNEDQAKLLLDELKALKPKSSIDREALKQHASETIGKMKVSEIKPSTFHRGEVKAAQRYTKALADGDQRLAAFYKQEQLRQFYLFRAANEAERKAEQQRKYIKGVQTREYRDTEVDPSYIQNLKVLSNLYDARKSDRMRDLSAFTDWLMAQINAETEFLKPQILDLAAITVIDAKEQARENGMDWRDLVDIPSYDDMTIDQLQGVFDQLKHLRWLGGKLSNRVREERKAKNEALGQSVLDNGGDDLDIPDYEGRLDRAKSGIKRFGADHKKIRNVVLGLDGFQDFGPAHNAIYQPIVDATNAEVEMNMDYAKRVEAIWKPMNGRLAKGVDKRQVTKEDGSTWNLPARERVMLGMYWGSPESREAVLRGHGVTELDVARMLQHLTPGDLDFIQAIWELNDSLWPAFSAMNTKAFGVSPPKVDHVPFTINGRKMKGGYMRLYYDYAGQDAQRKDIHDSNNDFLGSGGGLAMSKAGAAFSRVGSGGRRVALSPQNIFTALQDNIHAITFTETSREVSRTVQSKPVADAIIQKYGKEAYQSLLDTMEGVFIGGRSGSHPLADMLRAVRSNMSLALLGMSIRNFVQQPIAMTNVVGQLGEMQTLKGVIEFYSSPIEMKRSVDERSAFMRNRTAFVNREVAEHLGTLEAGKGSAPLVWMKRHAFDLQTLGDAAVAYPAWVAAHDLGMKKFGNERKAELFADEQVASTIGSGLGKDLSAMLQGGGGVAKTIGTETLKQLTFMGSFFNVVFNLMNESYNRNDLNTVAGFAEFSRQMAWFLVIPAALSAMVISSMPDEDEDGYAAWLAKVVAEYGLGSVFMLRDIVTVAKGFDASIPGQSLPSGLARIVKETNEAFTEGEIEANDAAALIRGLQPAFPLPASGQVARYLDYMHSYEQGKEGEFSLYDALVEGKERNK